jgi:hypothetical protein
MESQKTSKDLPTAKATTLPITQPLTDLEKKSLRQDMKTAIDTLKIAFPKAKFQQ